MTADDLNLVTGIALTTVGALVTLQTSLIEECLKTYHRAELFENLPTARVERLEVLLRQEDELFFAARLARLFAYALTFTGVLGLFAGGFDSFTGSHVLYALLVMVAAALLLGGVLPVIVARHWAESTLLMLLPGFHRVAALPFSPFFKLSEWLSRGVAKVAGEEVDETPEQEFEDDIADSLDEATRDGLIGEGERRMIASIVDLKDLTVKDVMRPRTEMVCVNVLSTIADAIDQANARGHARLPVFEGNRDNIVGIFYVRDALSHWRSRDDETLVVRDVMRDPTFVPESKSLLVLLAEFRNTKRHMAIVLDEFGGTEGLATLEDLMEEIVGEIQDEFDNDEDVAGDENLSLKDVGPVELDARVRVQEVNKRFRTDLPESVDYTSISGLLSSVLGRIPGPGESVRLEGVEIEVLDATDRMVRRVRLVQREALAESQASADAPSESTMESRFAG